MGVWVCVCLSVLRWRGPNRAAHGVAGRVAGAGGVLSEERGRCGAADRQGLGNVIGYKVLVELQCNC